MFLLLARDVGACFAEKHGPDAARVARHLVNDRGFPAGPALKAAHSPTYRRNIRTKIRPQQECLARLKKVRDDYKAASEDYVREGALGLFLSVHHLTFLYILRPSYQSSCASNFSVLLCRNFL